MLRTGAIPKRIGAIMSYLDRLKKKPLTIWPSLLDHDSWLETSLQLMHHDTSCYGGNILVQPLLASSYH